MESAEAFVERLPTGGEFGHADVFLCLSCLPESLFTADGYGRARQGSYEVPEVWQPQYPAKDRRLLGNYQEEELSRTSFRPAHSPASRDSVRVFQAPSLADLREVAHAESDPEA